MFTVKDYKKMSKNIEDHVWDLYTEEKLKWVKRKVVGQFLEEKEYLSETFDRQNTPHEMIDMINKFIKEIKELPHHQGGVFELALNTQGSNDEYCEIDDNHYTYVYYVLQKEEDVEDQIKRNVKTEFAGILKPKEELATRSVDCSLMKLFLVDQ